MKYIYYSILVAMLIFVSCQKEDYEILDLRISPDDISRIELKADHKTLVPNGINAMGFHTQVYAKKTVMSYGRDDETREFYAKETEEEFLVPNDQIPEGLIKYYDQDGNVLENGSYKTNDAAPGTTLQFYAKCGNLESNKLNVTIREIPDESYEEIVIPVVFHILLPPATQEAEVNITTKYLEEQLQRVSDAFNRKITTDPNAGNAKIVFKLAEYDNSGNKMMEKGKHMHNISSSDYRNMGTSYNKRSRYLDYIVDEWRDLIWDPNRYLNIWLAKFNLYTSTHGSGTSYSILPPTVMHPDYDKSSVPGIDFDYAEKFTIRELEDCREVGIMVNTNALLAPSTVQGSNDFSLATPIAAYLGLLQTYCPEYDELNSDGDNDYCPDTYSYDYGFYRTVFKGNNLDGQPEDEPSRPMEYFTSFNVMDIYSYKNSLSVDQVKRIRMVLKQCPSRWAYKSKWAFTGDE